MVLDKIRNPTPPLVLSYLGNKIDPLVILHFVFDYEFRSSSLHYSRDSFYTSLLLLTLTVSLLTINYSVSLSR